MIEIALNRPRKTQFGKRSLSIVSPLSKCKTVMATGLHLEGRHG